jgi:hypothetical protein
VPPGPTSVALVGAAVIAAAVRWRRVRPRTWTEQITHSAERAGRRAGRPRRPNESFSEYATAVGGRTGSGSAWRRLALSVEASAYGGLEPSPEATRQMVTLARRLRRGRAGADPGVDPHATP